MKKYLNVGVPLCLTLATPNLGEGTHFTSLSSHGNLLAIQRNVLNQNFQ